MVKKISIIGSTGSIGTQTLEVVSENPEKFTVKALTTYKNIELMVQQAKKFQPDLIVAAERSCKEKLEAMVKHYKINHIDIDFGEEGLKKAASLNDVDTVMISVVGFSGVLPTIAAVESGKEIALANKEALVTAGEIVMSKIKDYGNNLIPVDSEHSALFQCLLGEDVRNIKKLILTASGGPFRGKQWEELKEVTPRDALKHPNWDMGNKITIDSATMMNKGLEVIEAHWLFGVPYQNIDVIVHPQSIVHSMVEFIDKGVKAEMGLPDMKHPIQFALTCPERLESSISSLNFADLQLTFEPPDYKTFPCLRLAFEAGKAGGTMPCVLNAANEIAVQKFLSESLTFDQIPFIIKRTMEQHRWVQNPSLEDIIQTDAWAREKARNLAFV